MQHVADAAMAGAGLPQSLEDQRTRMFVRSDAPSHVNTVESASAYQAMGFENTFDIERFKRDFRVEVQTLTEEEAVFDLIGIDAALANAFRRILLAEVPTMAIEKVFILNNTSMIQDEVLAQRLGLIPIRADPRKFNARNADDDADADNVISFRLQVKCTHAAKDSSNGGGGGGGGGGSSSGGSDGVIGASVTSGISRDCTGRPGRALCRRPHPPIARRHLDSPAAAGREIELEAWCEKGLGWHAKWSPVCTASYRLLPNIRLRSPSRATTPTSSRACARWTFSMWRTWAAFRRPRRPALETARCAERRAAAELGEARS